MGYFGRSLATEVVDYFFVAARFLEVSRGCIERWGRREWTVTFVECRRTATPSVFSSSFAWDYYRLDLKEIPPVPRLLHLKYCSRLAHHQSRTRLSIVSIYPASINSRPISKYLICRPNFQRMRPRNTIILINYHSPDIRLRHIHSVKSLYIRLNALPQRKR